jgi:GNAT superfamily N-acetyltransferase
MPSVEIPSAWDTGKEALAAGAVNAVQNMGALYAVASPGKRFIDQPMSEHVRFTATRSKADAADPSSTSILLNILHNESEVGQLELRCAHATGAWSIPDRHTLPGYEGKGIFSALLAAGERFFSDLAERDGKGHTVEVKTGQRHVLEVFEHKGYAVHPDDADTAELVRHPDLHADEVVEKHAWSKPQPQNGTQVLLDDRDAYVFRRDVIAEVEHPTFEDAVRVTLTKIFHPVRRRVGDERDTWRIAVQTDLAS